MDEIRLGKTGSKLSTTEDNIWLPPLSLKEQKKADRLQKKPFAERIGVAGKTPWDWVQLLIQLLTALALPIALFLATQWFTTQQNQASEMAAVARYANDQQLATDQQRETTLQAYLDNISDLLLKQNLAKSQPGDKVSQVARQRTLTALRRLDAKRNRIVLRFLQDTHLIGMKNAVIDLSHTDLSNDVLSQANLSQANLSQANLSQANLSEANLSQANLSQADLSQANLSQANMHEANLNQSNLNEANLSGAYLRDANLRDVSLGGANMHEANLNQSNLSSGYLCGAYLRDASLSQANLSQAYLSEANLSAADLSQASLSGADLSAADLSQASLSGANLSAADLNTTILKSARYNAKEILIHDLKIPPTIWPQGFDPKAAGAIEDNTFS